MLCNAMQYCSISFYVQLCSVMVCCANTTICYVMLYYAMLLLCYAVLGYENVMLCTQ